MEPKKKIIKKMVFKKKGEEDDDAELKEWKPTKIERKSDAINTERI